MTRTGAGMTPPAALAAREQRGPSGHHLTFWKRFLATIGSRGAAFGLGAGVSILIARLLGPTGQGAYSVLVTLGLLGVQLGTLGLNTSTAYHGGALRESVRQLVGFILAFAAIIGVLLGSSVLAVEAVAPHILPVDGSVQAILVALYLPLGLFAVLSQALLLGLRRIAWYNSLEVGQAGLTLAGLAIVAVLAGATPESFYAITLAVTATAGIVGLAAGLRGVGRPGVPARDLVERLLRYGARSYLANLFSFVVLYIDVLMVAALLDDTEAGFYAIAARVAEWAYTLPIAAGAMLFATLVEQEPSERRRFTLDIAFKVALGMPLVLISVGVLAPFLVEMLYGEAFLPSLPALYWLLPAIFALGLHTLAASHLAVIGMPWVAVASPALGALVNLALNFWLIPARGIQGAALASLAAYVVMVTISLGWVIASPDGTPSASGIDTTAERRTMPRDGTLGRDRRGIEGSSSE